MFTAYRINLNGELTDRENLDSFEEVSEWAMSKKFGHIRVIKNETGKTRDALITTEPVQTQEGEVWVDYYEWIS